MKEESGSPLSCWRAYHAEWQFKSFECGFWLKLNISSPHHQAFFDPWRTSAWFAALGTVTLQWDLTTDLVDADEGANVTPVLPPGPLWPSVSSVACTLSLDCSLVGSTSSESSHRTHSETVIPWTRRNLSSSPWRKVKRAGVWFQHYDIDQCVELIEDFLYFFLCLYTYVCIYVFVHLCLRVHQQQRLKEYSSPSHQVKQWRTTPFAEAAAWAVPIRACQHHRYERHDYWYQCCASTWNLSKYWLCPRPLK